MKVHVVDDDPAVRHAISLLLRTEGMEVKTYCSASAFLAAVESCSNGCLVADVSLPGEMSGIELVRAMKEKGFSIPAIMITGHGDVKLAVTAMKLGASDFIQKPFEGDALIEAVKRAIKQAGDKPEVAAFARSLESLTAREREVLERIVSGETNKVAAQKLGISSRTVEAHRAKIMAKTKAKSLSALVRIYSRIYSSVREVQPT